MTARAALRAGLRELGRWPLPTLLALVGALTAATAARVAWVRAGALWTAARGAGTPWPTVGRALGLLLSGHAAAALLVDATRAAALSAYGLPRPDGRLGLLGPLRLGLARTPAMVSVRAVELTLYFALALGNLFVLARALGAAPPRPLPQALVATALLGPSLASAMLVFAAARVAQALIARGLPAAPALAHGYDVALRRFASLARLALLGLVATLPIHLAAAWLPTPAAAPLEALAALWVYAALVALLGRDPRLALG